MAFDATVQPLGFNITAPSEEELAAQPGREAAIEFTITIGLQLPFQQAPGQPPMMVPLGNVRVPLSPDIAEQIGEKLVEEGKRLPKRPPIDIANTLDGVDQAQQFEKKIRGQ